MRGRLIDGAVCGGWARQLDPPESRQLFLRGSSLSWLFPQSWLLAPTEHGKYLRMRCPPLVTSHLSLRPMPELRGAVRLHVMGWDGMGWDGTAQI